MVERRKKTTEGTPGNEGKSVEEMAGRQEGRNDRKITTLVEKQAGENSSSCLDRLEHL